MESASGSSTTTRDRPRQQPAIGTAAAIPTVHSEKSKAVGMSSNQLPSVLNPAPITKLTYEEATNDIVEKISQNFTRLQSMEPMSTSIVLYDQNGAALKSCDGPVLETHVSLCYLITWLQIFADNFLARHHPGVELVVKSVDIRFLTREKLTSYPGLEGEVCYSDTDPTAVVGVNWACNGSLVEQYWEAYRDLMQMRIDKHIKWPILKIKTAKLPAKASQFQFKASKTGFGGGHEFVVAGKGFGAKLYFEHMGQRFPDSLTQLDKLLTDKHMIQSAHTAAVMQSTWDRPRKVSALVTKEEGQYARGNESPSIREPEHSMF